MKIQIKEGVSLLLQGKFFTNNETYEVEDLTPYEVYIKRGELIVIAEEVKPARKAKA